MHFSVGKAVTVALMGLGNVLLTANAAPAEIVRARDPNVPENHLPRYSDQIASLVVARSPKGGKGDSESGSGSGSDSSSDFGDWGTTPAHGANPGGFGIPPPDSSSGSGSGPNPGGFSKPPPKDTDDGSNSGSGSGSGSDGDRPPVAEGTVDLRERGYEVKKGTTIDGSTNFEIREEPGARPLVDMLVNTKQNSYTIKEAWNDRDKKPNKARLAEMVLSIWVNDAGKKPGDLTTVRLLSITEETTKPVLAKAIEKKGGSGDFTVTRNSEDPVDKEIFEGLTNAAWGKHVQKTLDLGKSGKEIESYRIQSFNMVVNLA